ncbi:MAG: transcription termination factor NusA [Anaerovoracaceae bacterium]|jgi:N utilization substance protein A
MNKEFIEALDELEKEKDIPKNVLLEMIEFALESAYRKNYGPTANVRVLIDRENGDVSVLMRKDIVADEDFVDDTNQMTLDEAHEIDPRYEIGDYIEFSIMPKDFGRIAAQTAKQIVVQKIREMEHNMIYDDFITRQGEIVTGTVQRKSGETIFVNLGKAEGILPANEQVPGEYFGIRQRLRVYIMDVKKSTKGGPQVFLSRSHPGLVKRLFELEVPEIHDGTVEIRGIAREAGSRTKLAVWSQDPNVDPVGACVGTHGSRVQAVVDELNGEKIDIITWSDDPVELISSVLSPADVEGVVIEDEEAQIATAIVPDYQLSLAIGKQGQNVRLAARVSGWKIDIKSHTQYYEQLEEEEYEVVEEDELEDSEEPAAEEDLAEEPEGSEAEEEETPQDPDGEAEPEEEDSPDEAESEEAEPEEAESEEAEPAEAEPEEAEPEEEPAGASGEEPEEAAVEADEAPEQEADDESEE